MMIKKNADGTLSYWKSAIDFDAYKVIFIHNFHYNFSYFSFVKFIFFNCVLIFSRLRKIDNDQFHLMISIRSIFSCSEREKAIHNDEIKVMIADHMHAWAEIQTTYDWYSRTEWIFVECKIEKTFEWIQILSYKRFHQLCFSSRDQILAIFIKKHCSNCIAWRFLIKQFQSLHFCIHIFVIRSFRKFVDEIDFFWSMFDFKIKRD